MAEDSCDSALLNQTQTGLQQTPLWNQGRSNLCYAFSAALLIDDYIAKNSTQELELYTSPLALASQTVTFASDKSIRTTFWGGNIQQSLKAAALQGTCAAGWLSDKLGSEELIQTIANLRAFQKKGNKQDVFTQTKVAQEILAYLKEQGGSDEELPSKELIVSFFSQKQDHFMGSLLSSLCKDKTKFPLPAPQEMKREAFYTTGITLATQLNSLLTLQETPVALEFCSEVVTNPNFSTGYNTICSRHYAVAVGQRKINGSCEILMRDSQCEFYNSIQKDRCANGHYWIKRADIIGYVDSLSWL